ncbi:MAG: glycosyl transferase [Bacteroidia bacterium]|nr:MAG: glycosyl transferase [Bacteroidia bacterium]
MRITPLVSVILVQHNQPGLTREAIESFRAHYRGPCEIIVVDNGSTHSDRLPAGIHFLRNDQNRGYGAANNRASEEARGDVLLFLNNDTVTTMDFVSPVLEEFVNDPRIGIVGPKILNTDGTLQLSNGPLPSLRVEISDKILYRLVGKKWGPALRYAARARTRRETEWVTGAALFIRKDLFRKLGGFDERFFMFFEDKDLCARARLHGYLVRFVPEVSVIHLRGGSSGERREWIEQIYRESQFLYYEKHRPKMEKVLLRMYLAAVGKVPWTW